ncbi:hypothetical protein THAOC_30917, partial [Thalassiosira oceanica]
VVLGPDSSADWPRPPVRARKLADPFLKNADSSPAESVAAPPPGLAPPLSLSDPFLPRVPSFGTRACPSPSGRGRGWDPPWGTGALVLAETRRASA